MGKLLINTRRGTIPDRGQGQSGRGSLNIAARNLIGHFTFDKIKVI